MEKKGEKEEQRWKIKAHITMHECIASYIIAASLNGWVGSAAFGCNIGPAAGMNELAEAQLDALENVICSNCFHQDCMSEGKRT